MFWRRKPGLTATQASELIDLLRDHGKKLTQLREDYDDLAKRHERLRGKYYATRPRDSSEDEVLPGESGGGSASQRSGARRPLLSDYWTPGKPAVHK